MRAHAFVGGTTDGCDYVGAGRFCDGLRDDPIHAPTREQKVQALIAKWQPRLGLQAWDIRYNEAAPCEADEEAAVLCDDQEQLAQLVINPATSDSHLEGIVIHELIHVVMRLYDNLANSAAGTLGPVAGPMVMEQIDNEQERVVNRIVEAIIGRRDVSRTRIELHKYTAWEAA